ncbi:hypothetical protein ACT17S_09900 [Glutamicibacter mysorens]
MAESNIIASVGSKGDSFDNAMAETSTWVGWYNSRPGDGLVGGELDDGALREHLHGAREADEVFACPPHPYAARLLATTSSVHNIEHRLWPTGTPATPRPGNSVPMQRFSA